MSTISESLHELFYKCCYQKVNMSFVVNKNVYNAGSSKIVKWVLYMSNKSVEVRKHEKTIQCF